MKTNDEVGRVGILFKEGLGIMPVKKLGEETPFHHWIPHVFLTYLDHYGQRHSLELVRRNGTIGLVFRMFDANESGSPVWCSCYQEGFGYHLLFSRHPVLDFKDTALTSVFKLSAGFYCNEQRVITDKHKLDGAQTGFAVIGPPLKRYCHERQISDELLVAELMFVGILPIRAWIEERMAACRLKLAA